MDIAERIGLVKEISKWVIESNFDQTSIWRDKGLKIRSAVNLTSTEILDDDFRAWVKDIIDEKGYDRNDYTIELTERMLSGNNKRLKDVLTGLREMGYRVAIDDFGTGYNSLLTIGEIPFDIIKIDKYFIDRLEEPEIMTIVKHIIHTAHELGGKVVAEGVERREQVNILRRMDCDLYQGFYFSRPLLPEDFVDYCKDFDIGRYCRE